MASEVPGVVDEPGDSTSPVPVSDALNPGALRQQSVDLTGRRGGIEQRDNDRSVDPGAVEVDVRREGPGQVGDSQTVLQGTPIVAQPEGC